MLKITRVGGSSCRRRAIGVAQHGVEGAGEVVGEGTAVIVLGRGNQAGQRQQQQEEQVQGKRGSQNPVQEPPASGNFSAKKKKVCLTR